MEKSVPIGPASVLAKKAVARCGVIIALTCRTFDVSDTCYLYSPLISDENEEIVDLLVELTEARKTWGVRLCFLNLHNMQGHPWNPKSLPDLQQTGTELTH